MTPPLKSIMGPITLHWFRGEITPVTYTIRPSLWALQTPFFITALGGGWTTHLKNVIVKLDHFAGIRMNVKNIWNHHLVILSKNWTNQIILKPLPIGSILWDEPTKYLKPPPKALGVPSSTVFTGRTKLRRNSPHLHALGAAILQSTQTLTSRTRRVGWNKNTHP